MANLGVDVFGFFTLDMGMGQAARAAAMALCRSNVSVAIHPRLHETQSNSDTSLQAYFQDELVFPINIFYVNALDTSKLRNLFGQTVLDQKYNIGVWNWELEKFPRAWESAIDMLDEIWVPSEFIRQAVLSTGTTRPVTLIPYPVLVGSSEFLPKVTWAFNEKHFHFLFVCDLNSYIERKNPLAAISAFQAAFPAERSDVRLVLKVHGKGSFLEARVPLLEAVERDRRLILIDANLGRHATESLHASCDAFISLHRSEGYGLNMAESMWLGKPVIATRYSGNLDFMDERNSCLVDFEMTPVLKGQYLLGEGQQWASPDINQAARYMKKLVDDPEYAKEIGKQAALSTRSRLSLSTVGAQMRSRLEVIQMSLPIHN